MSRVKIAIEITRKLVVAAALCVSAPVWAQQSAATAASATSGIAGARLVETLPLNGTLYHVQGVDLDQHHVWVTSVDITAKKGYLHQFDRSTGNFERQVELNDGPRFHPGGFSVAGDSIWVPVAEYRPASTAVLLELDKATLKVKRRIDVTDHLGCVAVTGSGELIAGNWGSRKLYVFDRAGKQIRVEENPSANQFQDIKFVDGKLVGGGNTTKTAGAVEWLDWPSLKSVRIAASGTTDRGRLFTAEGMALKGRDLYLTPEDGPSRLFHLKLER